MEPKSKAISEIAINPYWLKSILNFDEAALFLSLSKNYLYKLTSNNKIPHYKPHGKMLYFEREELEKWIRQNRVKTIDQIEQEATSHVVLGRKTAKKESSGVKEKGRQYGR